MMNLRSHFTFRFFPTYMEENCIVECNMLLYMKTCECLPYYFYNTQNIEVCNFNKLECIMENWGNDLETQIIDWVSKVKSFNFTDLLRNNNVQNGSQCECPAQCNSQTFTLRISNTDLAPGMDSIIDPFYTNITDQHMIVHVYFVSQVYRVFIRSLLTNFISLIANLGGVYSLLVGMSVLTAFEILYFFTVRLYLNYRDLKTEEAKPRTFSERMDNVNISTLKVPRLDTAKSDSSSRMSAYSHF